MARVDFLPTRSVTRAAVCRGELGTPTLDPQFCDPLTTGPWVLLFKGGARKKRRTGCETLIRLIDSA